MIILVVLEVVVAYCSTCCSSSGSSNINSTIVNGGYCGENSIISSVIAR